MTDDNLRPPHESDPGWKHDLSPQPEMLWKPLPWWRRVPLDAWIVAAILVAAAGVCVWLMGVWG